MLVRCWKHLIRFLCGKYIDLGKAVYHFAVPENLGSENGLKYGDIKDRYVNGISSFDLEIIKAEETRQREIANTIAAALSNFSRAVIDYGSPELKKIERPEDILFINGEELKTILKPNLGHHILRFYGGLSAFSETGMIDEKDSEQNLVFELLGHFNKIRNKNFHYTDGKEVMISGRYTEYLMENDRKAYQQTVRDRYYSNNAAMFYEKKDIIKLVKKLYQSTGISEAQIPAFRTVWKRKDIYQDIETWNHMVLFEDWKVDKNKTLMFESALYYLLKEIYYHDFILGKEIKWRFFKAVNEEIGCYKRNNDKEHLSAGYNFKAYLEKFRGQENVTFGTICQGIMQEYNQQNAKEPDKEIYKHFISLLPICIKRAFKGYIDEKYPFLKNTKFYEIEGKQDYLDKVKIQSVFLPETKEGNETEDKLYEWYTLAHFISPRRLNLFVGDLKNYIQYRKDIFRRSRYAGQFDSEDEVKLEQGKVDEKVKETEKIIRILEFVRPIAGRVSNDFFDYYDDEEEYAKYLNQYIGFEVADGKKYFESLKYFCQNTLPNGEVIDIYADAEHPKVLRNVELTRMYAGGDIHLDGHKKVSAEEIKKYYEDKKKVEKILANGLCESKTKQRAVKGQQDLKRRLMLHDVTDFYELVNDLLGHLISLNYLRERDRMYLMLGFYYMALRSENTWDGEVADAVDNEKVQVEFGMVLYQIISIFNFGMDMVYKNRKNKWKKAGGQITGKYKKFEEYHANSNKCAMRLFENEKYKDISELRNYVDHSKYYVNHDKSLLELYNEFYSKVFWYNKKLRDSVLHNFKLILERYFVICNVKFVDKAFCIDGDLQSVKFTYKLKDKKTVDIDARDAVYLEEIAELLQYKK